MLRALYSARTGMLGQQLQLDVVSNNLANVNTAGFKKARVQFEDLFYQRLRAAGSENAGGSRVPTGILVGMGVRPVETQKIFSQGDFMSTGNELDMAIEGDGFFKIDKNGETFYTRSGNFKRDNDGYIVTPNGDRLQPEFAIPDGTVQINIDSGGMLTAIDQDNATLGTVQITLSRFSNPTGLRAVGGNLFQTTDASGEAVEGNPGTEGIGTVAQRFLESSNVDVAEEIVNLIITQRAFEMNSKAITTGDSILEMANSLIR